MRVDAYRIGNGGDLTDPEGRFAAAFAMTTGGAVLVRPDGFVAWRAEGVGDDPARALAGALAEVFAGDRGVTAFRK